MRLLCLLFLAAFVGAVAIFVTQNQQTVTVSFWNWDLNASVAVITGGAFLLGMLSGWSVVGLLRRSLRRIEAPSREYAGSR